jgi:hypothetical protein
MNRIEQIAQGRLGFVPARRMQILTANTSKGELIYMIKCNCGQTFGVTLKKYRVICPNCGKGAFLHSLLRDWTE